MMKKLLLILLNITFLFASNIANDTDNDLVPNNIDKCPTTPNGVFVDRVGCKQKIIETIYFDQGKYNIKQTELDKIHDITELAIEGFGYNILIEGYTDSTASAKFNLYLSKQRAIAIENILLISNISKKRIITKWYGETMPIASNITKVGRAKNRRVQITFK
jgi:OOP family OmpA-OmpF porin